LRKIRWVKPLDGLRTAGQVEENDDDLCKVWVDGGHAEYVDDTATTDAEKAADDLERRRRTVEPPDDKAVDEPPVNRSMKGKGAKGR
jgi:hypothetical protein